MSKEELQTSILKHKKEESGVWCIIENDQKIFRNIPSEELAEQLVEFICTRDAKWINQIDTLQKENYALIKLTEFLQELISSTLSDKLADIDNMYAMKLMLKEMTSMIEDLIPKLENMNMLEAD